MGWIGTALIALGAWKLGHRHRMAFLLTMCGGLCWLVEGIRILKPDLVLFELVMIGLQFRNWIKWGSDESTLGTPPSPASE